MQYIVIVFALVICLLVYLMYRILNTTVNKVNEQTKTYFVEKLQVYDTLITEKEKTLNEIEEIIKNKKIELEKLSDTNSKKNYTFDKNIIDIMTDADYKEKAFELQKHIDESFDFDYEKIIKEFIHDNVDDKEYNTCLNIKNKFNSKLIYKIRNEMDLEKAIINELNDDEKKIFNNFKKVSPKYNIDDFLNYIDETISVASPYVEVQVANKKQNYDHLSKYIKTVVNDSIYKGIKIVYKNKVYDFSLNERNV